MGFCTMLIFLLGLILEGETLSVNMCESGTTHINDDNIEIDAFGPPLSPLTTNISTTCSCLINATHSLSKVSIRFSRETKSKERSCKENKHDEATLDLISGTTSQSLPIQNKNLSDYYGEHKDLSAIILGLTICSICGSNYTIRLTRIAAIRSAKFSHVTCSNPETVVASSSTTATPTPLKPIDFSTNTISTYSASPTALKPIDASSNFLSSTYSPKKNSTSSDLSKKGLIVGVGVGVGVGVLLLLVAIILIVIICRRRRTKPQPLTNANNDVGLPAASSYEPTVEYRPTSAVYEELRNSSQLQTGTPYDNQTATDADIYQNYNSLRGIGNDAYHHSDSVPNYDYRASEEEVNSSVQKRPHSIDSADTILVENDLYEK